MSQNTLLGPSYNHIFNAQQTFDPYRVSEDKKRYPGYVYDTKQRQSAEGIRPAQVQLPSRVDTKQEIRQYKSIISSNGETAAVKDLCWELNNGVGLSIA